MILRRSGIRSSCALKSAIRLLTSCVCFIATSCTPSVYPPLVEAKKDVCPNVEIGSILEFVLRDFVASEGPTWTLIGSRVPNGVIIDSRSRIYPGFIGTQLVNDLSRQEVEVPAEVLRNVDLANGQSISMRPYFPSASGYQLLELTDLFKQNSDRPGALVFARQYPGKIYVSFWLPGVSEDKQKALVRFNFGPAGHTCIGTYYLLHNDHGWRIKERFFMEYP